jgi:hypothetical protein
MLTLGSVTSVWVGREAAPDGTAGKDEKGRQGPPGKRESDLNLKAKATVGVAVLLCCLGLGAALASAVAPSVTVENAANVGYTTADAKGTVDPKDQETSYHFEYATQAQFEAGEWGEAAQVGFNSLPGGAGSTPVSEALSGLAPDTTYHLRLVADNADGQDEAVAAETFRTKEMAKPVVSDVAFSDVAYTTAKATGKVEVPGADEAFNAYCRFEYITQGQWEENGGAFPAEGAPSTSCEPETVTGTEPPEATPVAANLSGLVAGATYHLRLLASNPGGTGSEEAPAALQTKAVSPPEVTIDPVTGVTASSAGFSGTVNPNAPEEAALLDEAAKEAYRTNWRFECTPGCDGGGGQISAETVETEGDTLNGPNPVSHETTGLEPATSYTVRLIAENAGGPNTVLAEESFETDAVPAEISDSPTLDPTQTTATVVQGLNPHNSPLLDCRFVYGVGEPTGQEAPCEGGPSAELTGLTPGSLYHFKLVVTTGAGTFEGEEQTFPTFPEPAPEPVCPNQAIREEQDSYAPDCRAYEKVTPDDKNGADAPAGNDFSVTASTDGNAASYYSRGGFADTVGSGLTGFFHYVARRETRGWSSHGFTPEPSPHAAQAAVGGTRPVFLSGDLSEALVMAYDLPAADDDLISDLNLYVQDTASRTVQTITKPLDPDDKYFSLIGNTAMAGSNDLSHIAFSARGVFAARFLEDAAPGVANAYEWDHGVLRLAGVLPNGKAPSTGSAIPAENDLFPYRAAVSSDGSRIVFLSPPSGNQQQLYLRRNHTDSVWVTEPETSDPVANPQGVVLQWVSPSGHRLLFSTPSALLDDDVNGSNDLYLYTDTAEPAEESNLRIIGAVPQRQAVIGANEEATRIFAENDAGELLFFNDGETKVVVAGLVEKTQFTRLGLMAAEPGGARVSADATRLAFFNGEPTKMYLYDAVADALTCASCPDGGPVEHGASVGSAENDSYPRAAVPGSRPNFLSADGRRLFFSSNDSLVPGDANDASDAYVYDSATGETSLLSPGDTPGGVWFQEANLSGDDVFLVTRDHLVSGDRDSLIDLYDARVGGGFPEPSPIAAVCSGDGCRGPSSESPATVTPSSASFTGPDNKQCRQRLHQCRRHRKAHHKRHHRKAHHKKRASHASQGGGR